MLNKVKHLAERTLNLSVSHSEILPYGQNDMVFRGAAV